jgi:hypothetical protein
MATKPTEVERLSALIESKLQDLERGEAEGDMPSVSELNAIRRLIDWVEGERSLAEAREITKG